MEAKRYRVLITGANSYIGTGFAAWVKTNCQDIVTETLDMRDSAWKQKSFQGYDAIFHVAGIAHADIGKASEEQKQLYYRVNTDLTVECAAKARAEGVGQFLFMSSMIVYGESGRVGQPRRITRDTPVAPANFYGDSKAKAEEGLLKLETETFRVVILRPPMIYGKGSKGNYPLLARMAGTFPFFPKADNERSMLYIGNLCCFVSLMIKNEERGIFFPQNEEYVQTSELVREIASARGKRLRLLGIFTPFLRASGHMGGKIGGMVNKAFGNMTYEKSMSAYKEKYQIYDFRESVRLTEQ